MAITKIILETGSACMQVYKGEIENDLVFLEQDNGGEDVAILSVHFTEIDSLIVALGIIKQAWSTELEGE